MRVESWQRNLGAVWIGQMCSSIGFSFILPFIPLYVQSLGDYTATEAAQWAGVIGAVAALSMAITQPIWGNLADRFGRKPMLVRSMIGGSIVIGAMGFATTPEQLTALRFIQGAVTGVVAAATALIATSTPKEKLGFALGLNQVALFIGTSVGPLVGGVISDNFGYRAAFYASGVCLFVGGLIVVLFVREKFVPPPAQAKRRGVVAETRSLFALATFPLLVFVIFLFQFDNVLVTPVLSLFIAELAGGEGAATAAGTVLATAGAMSALSAVVIGRVSDRVGPRKILTVCLLGAAVAYVPQAFVQQVWELLALRMALGVFVGGLMPSANALVAGVVPSERRGAAYGVMGAVNALANGLGPLSGAAIATALGMRAVFAASAVTFTVTFAAVGLSLRGGRARSGGPAALPAEPSHEKSREPA